MATINGSEVAAGNDELYLASLIPARRRKILTERHNRFQCTCERYFLNTEQNLLKPQKAMKVGTNTQGGTVFHHKRL